MKTDEVGLDPLLADVLVERRGPQGALEDVSRLGGLPVHRCGRSSDPSHSLAVVVTTG